MKIAPIMEIKPGITAVIGAGGKTTLINKLAEEIAGGINGNKNENTGQSTTVVVCTTTHIMRPDNMPVFDMEPPCEASLAAFIRRNAGKPACVGLKDPDNPQKLISFPLDIIKRAAGENAYILVEADGAKHLPLKAHNENEPVIPEGCERVILVIGAEGLGRPIAEAVHRPEIFMKLAGADSGQDSTAVVSVDMLAKVLLAERHKFGNCRLQVLLNRTDTDAGDGETGDKTSDAAPEAGICEDDLIAARRIAQLTGWEVYTGSTGNGLVIFGGKSDE